MGAICYGIFRLRLDATCLLLRLANHTEVLVHITPWPAALDADTHPSVALCSQQSSADSSQAIPRHSNWPSIDSSTTDLLQLTTAISVATVGLRGITEGRSLLLFAFDAVSSRGYRRCNCERDAAPCRGVPRAQKAESRPPEYSKHFTLIHKSFARGLCPRNLALSEVCNAPF